MLSMNRTIAAVILLVLLGLIRESKAQLRPVQRLADSCLVHLAQLEQYLGSESPAPVTDVDSMEQYLTSDCPSVRAIAATILYPLDTLKYWDAIFEAYGIHDYAERSDSIYHMIPAELVVLVNEKLDEIYVDFKGKHVLFFLNYLYYGNHNEWIPTETGRLSVARFWRGAFLADAFRQTNIDVMALVTRFDHQAEHEDLY